ncbi:class I SAM-dependent methyltransferase [Devosia sp. XJ19-1]|uniref:Class I SAM-dependent methyltransferase n=1 Tax=Devosia ureilytica TaxID=2952754 RepID=A0A9Q4ARV1_9HYPH|nr:class I SAM-dependent methyltransferase [Devosia ureilytica]MCP8885312.1 class I SAM-dependent methyltransferase [Devosia ureilytica]MCP8888770.1 class I SAM-dependent methyltransferase [Devosia ureilytica]
MTTNLYPPDFYADRRGHTLHAARQILRALPEGLKRDRLADIGCGTGTFLAAALDMGAEHVFGIEGDWVKPAMLDDPRIGFRAANLEEAFEGPGVDLVLSLEVAEHLSAQRAAGFVADLVAMAPAVLFSAAIPGQGGVGHSNEQWQSFWAQHFAGHGYRAFDVVRPLIWSDEAVPAWYRQNIVLYLDDAMATALGVTPTDPALLDKVHPAFWARANRELKYANALPESEVLRQQAQQQQQ